jgi:AraC-like DNA-binding protein
MESGLELIILFKPLLLSIILFGMTSLHGIGEPRIGVAVLRGLELALSECSVDFQGVLAAAGISREELEHRDGEVSLRRYLNFMEQAARLADDPLLGIRLARFCGPETLGALGFLFLSSRSLALGLSDFCTYVNLLQDRVITRFHQEDGRLMFHYDIYGLRGVESRQDVEFSLALTGRLIRMFVGSTAVIDYVSLRHSAAAPVAEYERILNTRVRFDQETNSVVMPGHLASAGSHAMDAGLSDVLKAYLDEELHRQQSIRSYADGVKRVLLSNRIALPVTAEKVANYLAISPATLYRRLRQENTTFRRVANEVGFELATAYLSESSLTITQIAHAVGFTETASFTRAFSRWSNGVTPSRFRRSKRSLKP